MARNFSNISPELSIVGSVATGDSSITVNGDPVVTAPFTMVLSPDATKVKEEIVEVTAVVDAGGGNYTLTVTRGQGGTTSKTHVSGAAAVHVITVDEISDRPKKGDAEVITGEWQFLGAVSTTGTLASGALTVTGTAQTTSDIGVGQAPPKTYSGGYKSVQFSGAGIMGQTGGGSADDIWIMQNVYYASGFKYSTTNVASSLGLDSGTLSFATAGSGSADATATLTNRLVVNSTGATVTGTLGVSNAVTITSASDQNAFTVFRGAEQQARIYVDANGAVLALGDNAVDKITLDGRNGSITTTGNLASGALTVTGNQSISGSLRVGSSGTPAQKFEVVGTFMQVTTTQGGYYVSNGTSDGYFALSNSTNGLLTGTVADDTVVRASQRLYFGIAGAGKAYLDASLFAVNVNTTVTGTLASGALTVTGASILNGAVSGITTLSAASLSGGAEFQLLLHQQLFG